MKKEEIYLGDWQRILIGHAPAEFMLEVLVRTLIIYVLLLMVLRLLGKHMNAQLTITEMAVMITLGAIVAVPMQASDSGILPAVVILLCALAFQHGINLLSFHSRIVEVLTQGDVSLVVSNGVLNLKELEKARITRQQLFGSLRNHNVRHLGEVERAYLEACGLFSVFTTKHPKPGLSIRPDNDKGIQEIANYASNCFACCNCGNLATSDNQSVCDNCQIVNWVKPIV